MHWLDRAAAFASVRTPLEKRPFHNGWGDRAVIERYLKIVDTAPPISPIVLQERPARRSGTTIVRDITFDSPYADLPGPVRKGRARWFTTRPEPERIMILFPGWNDEEYITRTRLAKLLITHGIASLMPMQPFYGDRRRDPALTAPITTVSDFCLMGRGAVMEGRSLAKVLTERGYRVGVGGYSMGGNLGGFVAATVDFPVASALIATGYSPGPIFKGGILRHTVAWDALGGETPEAVEALGTVIDAASILHFPAPPHTAAAVILAGTKDGFVPNATTLALHRHWKGSKMDWVTAGHASLLWQHRDRMVAAIVDAFDRLDDLIVTGRT
jgi:hypothetical protein